MKLQTDLYTINEDRLMRRTLEYAKRHGYTRFTSTLEEAWRLSISGITASLIAGAGKFRDIPEINIDSPVEIDPLTEFGFVEARRHRSRGITLSMFLGLLKYYRQSYIDLVNETFAENREAEFNRLFVNRCFDRIEIAFCQEWAQSDPKSELADLQKKARQITNEKNTYLTVFESLSDPVIILDSKDHITHLNNAASLLVDPTHIPGGHYYHGAPLQDGTTPYGKHHIDTACIGKEIAAVFPSLKATLPHLKENPGRPCECEFVLPGGTKLFEVKRSELLDVSEKLSGEIVILRDVTTRKQTERELQQTVSELAGALTEVKRLSGLLPICANCKKVRDDKGYWRQVEQYVSERSEATFSHGICPDCLDKYYPDYAEESPTKAI